MPGPASLMISVGVSHTLNPYFISVRTRLPLYKGDVGVHYLKVLVKILKEDEFVATFGLQGEEDGKMLVIRML